MPDIMNCEICRGADLSTNTPHAPRWKLIAAPRRKLIAAPRRKLITPKFTRRDFYTMPPKKDKKERKKRHRWSV
jgi:hypothetical protein